MTMRVVRFCSAFVCALLIISLKAGAQQEHTAGIEVLPENPGEGYAFSRTGYLHIDGACEYSFAVSGESECLLEIAEVSIRLDADNWLAIVCFEAPGSYPITFHSDDDAVLLHYAAGAHERYDAAYFQDSNDLFYVLSMPRGFNKEEMLLIEEAFEVWEDIPTGYVRFRPLTQTAQADTAPPPEAKAKAIHKVNLSGMVAVTEMMYNPATGGAEFLELRNISGNTIDLSGAYFSNGIVYTFPGSTTLPPNAYLVLVQDTTAFTAAYPGVGYFGTYAGSGLSGAGETLTLVDAGSNPVFSFTYDDESPWPTLADGLGYSLVNTNPAGDMNDYHHWRASAVLGGEPGEDNSPIPEVPAVLVNEVLTHTDPPLSDSVEFYNPTGSVADIRGWFITDDRAYPQKARIPNRPEFNLQPGAYAVIYQNDMQTTPGTIGTTPLPGFALSSVGEEDVYLFSADAAGSLTGYSHGYELDGAENGVSAGRFTTSDGVEHFFPQTQLTLNGANSGPAIADVVVSEIYYQPLPGEVEHIVLTSRRAIDIPLWDDSEGGDPANTWRINGIGFGFPPKAVIPAYGSIIVANNSPDLFRTQYDVPAGVAVYGPFGNLSADGMSSLNDEGETLTLLWPDKPAATGEVAWIPMDKVRYRITAPWQDATGNGLVLKRTSATVFGGEPTNWNATSPTYPLDNGGAPTEALHSADYNHDLYISLSELMRVVDIYLAGGYQCTDTDTVDGYLASPGASHTCTPHSADYAPQDWQLSLSELLRVIQVHQGSPYTTCSEGEDGICLD